MIQIGIGIRVSGNTPAVAKQAIDFDQVFGNALPTIFELVSNEFEYKEQSSYAFDLNYDAGKLEIILTSRP